MDKDRLTLKLLNNNKPIKQLFVTRYYLPEYSITLIYNEKLDNTYNTLELNYMSKT